MNNEIFKSHKKNRTNYFDAVFLLSAMCEQGFNK